MEKWASRRLLIVLGIILVVAVADFLGVPLDESTLATIERLGITGILGLASEDVVKAWRTGQAIGEAATVLSIEAEAATELVGES